MIQLNNNSDDDDYDNNNDILRFCHQQQVKYDRGNRVFITPNIKYKSQDKLAGICGNFNGQDTDDYIKRDGNTANNDGDLGDGWANEVACSSPQDTDFETVCAQHKDRENWAKKGDLRALYPFLHNASFPPPPPPTRPSPLTFCILKRVYALEIKPVWYHITMDFFFKFVVAKCQL